MLSQSYLAERLIFVFLLGLVLLQYPILSLVNIELKFAGIPVLFIYLFGVWALMILLLMVLMEFAGKRKDEEEEHGEPER